MVNKRIKESGEQEVFFKDTKEIQGEPYKLDLLNKDISL